MDNHIPEFNPEEVDAQVDGLLAHQSPASQNAQIVNDLRQMYQSDEYSFRNVWERLGLEDQQPDITKKQPGALDTAHIAQRPASATILDLERNPSMHQTRKRSFTHVFSLLIAACVVALLVGSMLFISSQIHQNNNLLHTAAPGAPQGLYANDATSVFKLDPRTHQTLWQQALKGVVKIIPSGKVVYILQSNAFSRGTNAVLELDAGSGKTLWTHAFSAQGQNRGAFITDMVLVQNRLYVGWQKRSEGLDLGAQIYVLEASNGTKLMAYPATNFVGSMTAGAGVLAVSAESSLQVYDLATGKALWHVPFVAGTNGPVISVKIANGLVYAVVMATTPPGSAPIVNFIAAYKASTGEPVWQSPNFPDGSLSLIAVNQNVVYFGTTLYPQPGQRKPVTGRIYAYDVQGNRQLWSTPVAGATLHPPIFSDGVVYVAVDSGPVDIVLPTQAHIVAINAATGSFKWQQTLTSDYIYGFCLGNGAIYASSFTISQGKLMWKNSYSLKASDGSVLWKDSQHNFYNIVSGG